MIARALVALSLVTAPFSAAEFTVSPALHTPIKKAFDEASDEVSKKPRVFEPELLSTDSVLAPFATNERFKFPFVKTNEDGGQTTRRFDGAAASVEGILAIVKEEGISIVLQLEHVDQDEWPAALVDLVPPELRDELTTTKGDGVTVHAYVSAPGTAALPTHSDKGDVLVVQVAGAKDWTLGAAATTLAPGDALWIPAGQPHSARARDDDVSCHLTIHRVTEDHLARRLWDLEDDDNAQFNENSCYIGDRGCDGCNCGSCNLCSDGGAFCTTSADQMTISNPCCEYEENGYYYLGNCDGENSSPVDAWMWRAKDPRGKTCEWVAERPERRCDTDGIFIDTAWATIDTRGWLDVAYGEDYLYENQPVYKAFEACPISCSYTGACKDLTFEEWHYEATNSAGEKEEFGCCHVAERPETRCGRTSDDGVVASDACPVACGFCEPCVDDGQWYADKRVSRDCVWVSEDPETRCKLPGQPSFVSDTRLASEACPLACGTCPAQPSCDPKTYAPTYEPTPGPAPAYEPTSKPAPGPDPDCADSTSFFKKDDPSKDCAWVAKQPAERCLVKSDQVVLAAEVCLKACGGCSVDCQDDKSWFKAGSPEKDCVWVSRFTNRLAALGDDGRFGYQACPAAARTCRKTCDGL
mmetsp:Transcript_13786/g.42705  ORF Transcript_13786/g.42705 Transcript_13786/m.42705 type:complete len:640 (-) Transcript_13786:185-2104(-)